MNFNFSFIKKLLFLFTILSLGVIFFNSSVTKTYAATGTIWGIFSDSNSGTAWQVRARIYDSGTGNWTGYHYVYTNSSSGGFCGSGNCGMINFGVHDVDSSLQWATACVDPQQGYHAGVICSTCSPIAYAFVKNVSCPAGADSVAGQPASCRTPNGWGNVPFNGWCPSGNYCMYAGSINTTSSSWCPGAFAESQVKGTVPSSCTDYAYVCHRAYCDSNQVCHSGVADTTGVNCRTAACQCSYTSDPATPSLNNATNLTCAGDNNPTNVGISWDATARATNYTAQYRDCGVGGGSCASSWTSVDRNTSLSYTIPIPNADQGHTYQWRVRADNCHGNTYSGTKTFVIPDCHPPKGSLGASCTPSTNTTAHTVAGTPAFWGYACQAYSNYATKIAVKFKDGTTLLGSTVANLSNEAAVDTACGGNTGHRFVFNAPASVVNDKTHQIHAYAVSQLTGAAETEISNSPATFGQCKYDITANVYQDLNGNGAKDATETWYQGATINISGGPTSMPSGSTNATGQYIFTNLDTGTYNVTLTVPNGYRQTTPKDINGNLLNPTTATVGPNTTVNFGIQPPGPICSGGLVASPTTVHPGDTSTLTAVGCTTGGQGGTLTYTWLSPTPGSITSTNPSTVNTATWKAPTPYWKDDYAYPTVNVCQTGTTLCTPYSISNGLGLSNAGIHIVPAFSISGNVFIDQNKDGQQNTGDANYTGTVTIVPNAGTVTYPAPAGSYLISNLPGGTYTISYDWPARYVSTNPKANLRPAVFTVTVGNTTTGTPCNTNGVVGATCDNGADPTTLGNISVLRFGISNSMPWIQSIGGDITGSNVTDPTGGGFSNPIPAGATCGTYTSLVGSTIAGGGSTPGVVFSGAGSYDFGSGQASQNPYNWVLGGLSYPDTYTPKTNGVITTSYNYISSIAKQSGITPVDISAYCGAGGLNSCTLPANLPNGVYLASGGLTLTGPSYTFPANKNYVILVNGDLHINTEIHVPVGSTATFSSSNDILIGETVGEATITSTRTNIEGYFSADKHFTIQGIDACPTTDLRLNVGGSIVVNAALNSAASLATQANFVSGGFVNERDLCSADLQCPAFSVIERPDFIINAPDFFKTTRRVWREVAP